MLETFPNKTILIIEDESSIADNINYALKSEGFSVICKERGMTGIEVLKNEEIDLVILDVGLPDISGFDVCRKIRKDSDIPIIFLTARGDEIDRVVGLEIGADDYVVKPFSPRELVARVKVILRRVGHNTCDKSSVHSDFQLDEYKQQIIYGGHQLELTRYEFGILCLLIKHPGRVYSREQLMNAVWLTPEESFERAVDTHIKTLRAKLRAANPDDNSILTHRGFGYSFKST